MHKRVGVSRFSVNNFLSDITEKFRKGTLLCFRKILVSKNFMEKRIGASRFSVANVLSHSSEKICKGNHSVYQKNSDVESFHA